MKHREHFRVIAADRIREGLPEDVDFVQFDLLQAAKSNSLYHDLHEPDICVHLAWRDGFSHNALSHIEDFPYHFGLLKNLVDHGTKQFAVAGSFREYGRVNGMADHHAAVVPDNFYSLSKTMLKNALEIYFKDKDICLQWLRPFTVYGDDARNHSIMSKIIEWEKAGRTTFPFTDGSEKYDYIHVDELAKQITAVISQTEVDGVIDCCSGAPTRLGNKIEEFLKENRFRIRPEYGAFPTRAYDSPVIYGNNRKIIQIMKNCDLIEECK